MKNHRRRIIRVWKKKAVVAVLAALAVGGGILQPVSAAEYGKSPSFRIIEARFWEMPGKVHLYGEPQESDAPQTSVSPQESEVPQTSVSPQESEVPQTSVPPRESEVPQVSHRPFPSLEPDESMTPTETRIPQASATPNSSSGPVESNEPGESVKPVSSEDTSRPGSSDTPSTMVPHPSNRPSSKPDLSDTAAPSVKPSRRPGYLAGDPEFVPNMFGPSGNQEHTQTDLPDDADWNRYETMYSHSDQVILPGVLSDVLQIEKETSLKKQRQVSWGDARKKQLYVLTKEEKAKETVPGTADSARLEWLFPVVAGSAAVLAGCICAKKKRKAAE